MSTIDDYAQFLTARWDETERAHAVHEVTCEAVFWGACTCGYLRADLAAKRAIVEWHQSWPVLIEGPTEIERLPDSGMESHAYRASRQIQWATEQEYVKRFGTSSPAAPILRLLAEPFRDHPDHPANQ